MFGELSSVDGRPHQAANEKHDNLHLQSTSALPIVQSGPVIPPLSPPSAARMHRLSPQGPPEALKLPHQYQPMQPFASGTVGPR